MQTRRPTKCSSRREQKLDTHITVRQRWVTLGRANALSGRGIWMQVEPAEVNQSLIRLDMMMPYAVTDIHVELQKLW